MQVQWRLGGNKRSWVQGRFLLQLQRRLGGGMSSWAQGMQRLGGMSSWVQSK